MELKEQLCARKWRWLEETRTHCNVKPMFSCSPAPFLCPLKHPCSECQRDSIRKKQLSLESPGEKGQTSRTLRTVYIGEKIK